MKIIINIKKGTHLPSICPKLDQEYILALCWDNSSEEKIK